MKSSRHSFALGIAAFVTAIATLMLLAPERAAAQSFMVFGDVESYLRDSIAGTNGTLSSLAGLTPNGQLLSGGVKLHMNQRLSFDKGELYVNDTLSWLGGSDGSALSNELIQGYVALTPIPALTFVIGRRRMSWGTGYAFAPGDRINPPMSPGNRAEGFDGILATLSPSASFTLTGAVRFDTAFPALDSLSVFSSNGNGSLVTTLPFLAGYLPAVSTDPWTRLRYALYADALLGKLELYAATTYQYQQLFRPALGFSYDLGGFIVDGEAALELWNHDLYPDGAAGFTLPAFGKPYPLASVGLQRTIMTDKFSLAFTAEYLYDGTGYDSSQAASFYNDLLPSLAALGASTPAAALQASYAASDIGSSAWLASGEVVPALGRNYAAFSATASVTNYFQASAAALVNLSDGSFALQPELRITRLSGIDVFTRGVIAWGRSDRTEFGMVPTPVTLTAGAIVHF